MVFLAGFEPTLIRLRRAVAYPVGRQERSESEWNVSGVLFENDHSSGTDVTGGL